MERFDVGKKKIVPIENISNEESRRIALAAQGFGRPTRSTGKNSLHDVIDRIGLLQIDSVNVVSRSHYLPLFSRLGCYAQSELDAMAWGRKSALFEYWAHEASLLPLSMQPLLRWRMDDVRHGATGWLNTARFLRERADLAERALAEIGDRGPLAASELQLGERGTGGWWGWSEAKRTVECLFASGKLSVVTRRGNFERVYGLPEMALPRELLNLPTPSRKEAQIGLLRIAARAQGVATEKDLRDYFRMNVVDTKGGIAALVERGELVAVVVEGWPQTAYLAADAKLPRRTAQQALLSPFDNAIWHRDRTERLFNTRVRLEIYTPAAKRVHGYYVLPFLEDNAITARVDLKADRVGAALVVKAAHGEPQQTPDTVARLADELRKMADWLGLETVRVDMVGDLAADLAKALSAKTG
jgi:uncharacterized protein